MNRLPLLLLGWTLLPHYRFEAETGLWRHRDHRPDAGQSLDDIRYDGGRLEYRARHLHAPESANREYLEEVRRICLAASEEVCDPASFCTMPDDVEALRWFPLPGEGAPAS